MDPNITAKFKEGDGDTQKLSGLACREKFSISVHSYISFVRRRTSDMQPKFRRSLLSRH